MTQPPSDRLLRSLFDTAVLAVSPTHCLTPFLPSADELPPDGKLIVVGAGKAAAAMAASAYACYGDRITGGCVVTRYGHGIETGAGPIEIVEAAHPVPDADGQRAAQRILEQVSGLTAQDTVIALISGGASALLALPAAGLTLADKQAINKALLRSGASIHEMNAVRKHLSAIKGGRLAAACGDASVHTFVISDVPGDDPSTVGSGPTLVHKGTREEAITILQRYGIDVPPHVQQHLATQACNTPRFSDAQQQRLHVRVIADARTALDAAAQQVRSLGMDVWVLSDAIEGEARDIGAMHAALAREIALGRGPVQPPCVLLSGGETTVTVRGNGRGGRNAEFLLGFLNALGEHPQISALACDTDGIDGIEDNAGAWLTAGDWQAAKGAGLSFRDYLDRNDAAGFFGKLNRLVVTGPTRTNVNDFRAVLIQAPV